jgi:DNA-binding XRE family transcriptional regulator
LREVNVLLEEGGEIADAIRRYGERVPDEEARKINEECERRVKELRQEYRADILEGLKSNRKLSEMDNGPIKGKLLYDLLFYRGYHEVFRKYRVLPVDFVMMLLSVTPELYRIPDNAPPWMLGFLGVVGNPGLPTTPDPFTNRPDGQAPLLTYAQLGGAVQFALTPSRSKGARLKPLWRETLAYHHVQKRGKGGFAFYIKDSSGEMPLSAAESGRLFDALRGARLTLATARTILYLDTMLTCNNHKTITLAARAMAKAAGLEPRLAQGNITWDEVGEQLEQVFDFAGRIHFFEIIDHDKKRGAFIYAEGGELFDISSAGTLVQADLFSNNRVVIPHRVVRWGGWHELVKGHPQSGFIPEHVFSYPANRLISKLAVAFVAQQYRHYQKLTPTGVMDTISWIFDDDEIQAHLKDRETKRRFRQQFARDHCQLLNDGWRFDYSNDYPEELMPRFDKGRGRHVLPTGKAGPQVTERWMAAKMAAKPPELRLERGGTDPALQKELTPERLKYLRKQARMTQGQLAEALGVTQQAVSYWEGEKREIDPYLLPKIKALLER